MGIGSFYLLRNYQYQVTQPHHFFIDLIGLPFEIIQKVGLDRFIPLGFLLPVVVIFGLFTYFPFVLNFLFSVTDGDSIRFAQREYIGLENYRNLFTCEDYLDFKTCSAAGYNFFTGMLNSFLFVLIQVPVMTVIALVTALVLNRKIKVRGFWRAMFFYPVMLSPVVVVNIWTWILHRKGILNELLRSIQKNVSAFAQLAEGMLAETLITVSGIFLLTWFGYKYAKIFSHRFGDNFSNANPKLETANKDADGLLWFILITLLGFMASMAVGEYRNVIWLLGIAGFIITVISIVKDWDAKLYLGLGFAGGILGMFIFIDFSEWLNLKPYRNENWLINPESSYPFFWLVFVYIWSHFGFYMLILLAGLQSIPKDYYDAAAIDGTRATRVFFRITLPLLTPTLLVVIVLSLIKGFQIFDEAWLLTGGGPGRATFMVVQFIYEYGFYGQSKQYGMAATASIVMGVFVGVLTFIQIFINRKSSM